FAPDRLGGQKTTHFAASLLRVPHQPALGEDVRTLIGALSAKEPRDDFLGMSATIDRRGIDPVDSQIDGAAHRRHRIVVILFPPFVAANRPRSYSDAGDVHVGGAELTNGQRSFHYAIPRTWCAAVDALTRLTLWLLIGCGLRAIQNPAFFETSLNLALTKAGRLSRL